MARDDGADGQPSDTTLEQWAERILENVQRRTGLYPAISGRYMTRQQVALVLHALADDTLLRAGMVYSIPKHAGLGDVTSIGRFLHACGDYLERPALEG